MDLGGVCVSWQKSFHEDNAVDPVDGSNVVALSAFLLSSLPTHVDRKILVKELWESGAEVIVGAASSDVSGEVNCQCRFSLTMISKTSPRPEDSY